MRLMLKSKLFIFLAIALTATTTSCNGGDPEAHRFELEIQRHELVAGRELLRVKQHDIVSLILKTDRPVSFHIHGYNITQDATINHPANLRFTAVATGSFPFTIHPRTTDSHQSSGSNSAHAEHKTPSADHDHNGAGDEIELGRLEVRPR